MRAVVFILIILGVLVGYAMIEEFMGKGTSPSLFSSENKVKPYYSSGTKTNTTTPVDSSPNYVGKVKIYNINKASEYNPSLIKIDVRPYKGEPINLTGWSIKTRKGTFTIPQGMEYYKKDGYSSDIIIKESSYLNIIGESEPFGTKKNFKTNVCLGYLSKSENIYPSFYSYCSTPKLEELDGFTPYCKEYLINQRTCKMPDYSSDFKISTDSSCVSYILNYFTYNGCFERSSKEKDFLSNYWYIYVNKNIVEELHDTVYLYDQNGILIDEYLY
ncbi:hypothetical protein KKA24_00285 [Patescibacteria group bacterium]|nr:hypothetical protein [Patescibacteria group bacterium]